MMDLKNRIDQMQKFLNLLSKDLSKASKGNKTASQRVRTGTISFSKMAKSFRKESVKEEKKTPSR
jgi:hypothetical protein